TFGTVDLVSTVEEYTTLLRCLRTQINKACSRAVVFPKALGHVDETISDLFDGLDKGVTPVPMILAETFKSLNTCRRTEGEKGFLSGLLRKLLPIKGTSGYTEVR
ncbi:hypothetical protein Goshw_010727, partial [Gossypium schwendimanii]|nr:hypothetical protein [Gossypium schwendimanii]